MYPIMYPSAARVVQCTTFSEVLLPLVAAGAGETLGFAKTRVRQRQRADGLSPIS